MWRDTTSYAQGDYVRTPRTYRATLGSVNITVTAWVYGDPTAIYMLNDLHTHYVELKSKDFDSAKEEALNKYYGLLEEKQSMLERLMK